MKKTLTINTGNAMLLNEKSEMFSDYDSVTINSGVTLVSRAVYEKLSGMGVSINGGKMKILDIKGTVVEVNSNTIITSSSSFSGCFIICDGNLIIEDAKGLFGITGLYAKHLFHSASVNIDSIHNIEAGAISIFPDDAKLSISNITLDETAMFTLLENTAYWVHGNIKALDAKVLDDLQAKGITFHCSKLIIYQGLYMQYRSMFSADSFIFVPDGHSVVGDITFDAATVPLYGDKVFVLGDLLIPHDQTKYLDDFSSLVVKGTVTMPVSAASSFKAVGKADDFNLYEGILLSLNGFQAFGHEQCQTAIERGITYTLDVNGSLIFMQDVTAQDMDAIAAVHCNGVISAPDRARGVLNSKVKSMNGVIIDIDVVLKKMYGDDFVLSNNPGEMIQEAIKQIRGDKDGSVINTGTFKL